MFSDGKGLFGPEVAIPRLATRKIGDKKRGGDPQSSSLSRSMVVTNKVNKSEMQESGMKSKTCTSDNRNINVHL